MQLANINYTKFLGGDFQFSTLKLDARSNKKLYKRHIFALQILEALTFYEEDIPYRAYQRLLLPKTTFVIFGTTMTS